MNAQILQLLSGCVAELKLTKRALENDNHIRLAERIDANIKDIERIREAYERELRILKHMRKNEVVP